MVIIFSFLQDTLFTQKPHFLRKQRDRSNGIYAKTAVFV